MTSEELLRVGEIGKEGLGFAVAGGEEDLGVGDEEDLLSRRHQLYYTGQ
jgi:hypothetical protein